MMNDLLRKLERSSSYPVEQKLEDFLPGQVLIASTITNTGEAYTIIGVFIKLEGEAKDPRVGSMTLSLDDAAVRTYNLVTGAEQTRQYNSDTIWTPAYLQGMKFFYMKASRV